MTPLPPAWTPGEAAALNEFLNSVLGKKWLGLLLSRKPQVDLTTTEKAALTGAFASGYESIFAQIALTRSTVQVEQSAGAKTIDPTKD